MPDVWDHLEVVSHALRQTPAGLFADLDGTIAPIVPDPAAVTVRAGLRAALRRLAARLTVVVLTGRDVASARRIVGLDDVWYAGNHGAEWWRDGVALVAPEALPYVAPVHAMAVALASRFADWAGVIVEDKGPSLSVHYRATADPGPARESILAFVRDATSARSLSVREGKMVVELRPPVPLDKGTALRVVIQQRALRGAVVLGDDLTDVDAFRALALEREHGVVGVSVAVLGPEAPPALTASADHTLAGPDAAERFLTWMAERA